MALVLNLFKDAVSSPKFTCKVGEGNFVSFRDFTVTNKNDTLFNVFWKLSVTYLVINCHSYHHPEHNHQQLGSL
jgi:hypothetical protein